MCGGGGVGVGVVGGIGAEEFFEVYLIHSEFTTHYGFNGRTIFFANYSGDNCIQNFSFGEVYRRIYGRKFSFTATRKRSRKT